MKKLSLTLIALSLLPSISMANLITNGTFDNNTSGWSGTYTAQPGGSGEYDFPNINTGKYYWGGNVASNSIFQIYNLTASDTSTLSSVGLNFNMSADLFGYRSQTDHSIFTVSFYSGIGASGSLLGSTALDSATHQPSLWSSTPIAGNSPNFQTATGILPSLTASIRFNLQSIRFSGSSNDGYADNLNFSLTPSVPEPATTWLFGSGLLLCFLQMRKKQNYTLSPRRPG
ncbi:PEP-CTERM protein-sorting domain-containing protein [Methylomagnum ishizawai]|uniref:PEP-CTERM protein-sorting domain-containing protein n=1 Tax=Methylomagnum ishizawai TaxID=1760988 RepID=A0A1Y6D370_9GAMM|nr:PEP-CTERM sorting domain-containing protein [Methylomagnum ishizawai]SMF94992.1 PEP-CTERM protein-sorting domain-containing protein [Methylomagnum ishizawai]